MEKDFNSMNNTYSPYMGFNQYDPLSMENDNYDIPPMFNPTSQYEQAYLYYRSLNEQLSYKIKCKEYENLCNKDNQTSKTPNRRIE